MHAWGLEGAGNVWVVGRAVVPYFAVQKGFRCEENTRSLNISYLYISCLDCLQRVMGDCTGLEVETPLTKRCWNCNLARLVRASITKTPSNKDIPISNTDTTKSYLYTISLPPPANRI